jgi:outer membrane protein assembly factor BamB
VLIWKRRGWAMNRHSGYTRPGRGVVLCDLDGNGKSEVLFAGVDRGGVATLTVADHSGQTVWEHAIPGITPDWPDSGIDQWTVGRFNGDPVADVVVQYHDLGHSSAKLLALDGRDGTPLWQATQANLPGLPRPMSSANFITADFDQDGRDDVGLMPSNGFVALSGVDGSTIASVRFYPPDPANPDEWKPKDCDAPYSTLIAAGAVDDTAGNHTPVVFFSDRLTEAALRVWPRVEKLWLVGEPHPGDVAGRFRAEDNPLLVDLDGDGRKEFCAFHAGGRLVVHDARTGNVRGECRLSATPTSEAVAADIDGDGRMDLLFGAGNKLVAVKVRTMPTTEARELWTQEFKAQVGTPVIADVDRDGNADILVPTADSQLHCIRGR